MKFRTELWKNILAFGLAVSLTITAAPIGQSVSAAQETADRTGEDASEEITLESVRAEAAASYASDEKKGFDIDFDQSFSGTGLNFSTDTDTAHYMEALENLRSGEDDHTIIIRFKTTASNGFLFGIGDGTDNQGKSMLLGLKEEKNTTKFRLIFQNEPKPGTSAGGLKGSFGANLNNGEYHTVAISFLPSKGAQSGNARLVIDGGQDLYPGNWVNWTPGLNKGAASFTKFEVGGGSFAMNDVCDGSAFNGEIDFLTIINKAYSEKELQKLTSADKGAPDFSIMFQAGTCRTWLFTGGTEGVADFSQIKTTRNWVGMFEDSMRASGSFVERGRFVFNTSKKGSDVAQILDEYDVRIAPFGTTAAGIMVGASDYRKGPEGIEDFKTNLQALLDKLSGDGKLPLLLTPYPSANSADAENIAAYTQAIQEVGKKKSLIVSLSDLDASFLTKDGTLTSLGHQEIANRIKTAVGSNSRTNYTFDRLSDGNYTIAKQTEDAELAQVERVTANENSISVSVDPATVHQQPVRLEYTLTDSNGATLSASVLQGQTEFTIDGLKKAESYLLRVYDVSRGNVRESYQPVKIAAAENAVGIPVKYEDGNVSVNAKIQELIEREEPATYLFMGDSITHGILSNGSDKKGFDNVPQMFAKYLDELGRTDDIVLNTAVSNATIATTLDQIEPRLTRYRPDVVMIMLGTNDVSYNGQNTVTNGNASQNAITVEQFKDRYKELVRKIHETNSDASVVLRVPCEMIVDDAHKGYVEKFDAIYDVAEEMRAEISGLNIAVVNHRQEWLDYQANVRNDNIVIGGAYGWLTDNVHPHGRGNISMFQQLIKELGLYVNTSELANYAYELNAWTDTSGLAAPVTQRGSRASFAMSALSGYANGLRNVTLTFTADGKTLSKTAEYAADGVVTLDGLDETKAYTVGVSGKDKTNSKEITFQATLKKETSTQVTPEDLAELLRKIEEAEALDISSCSTNFQNDYKAKIADIRTAYETNAIKTLTQLEDALMEIRAAMQKANEAIDQAPDGSAKREAMQKLNEEIAKQKPTFDAGRVEGNYTLESWSAYRKAYQAAKKADVNMDLDVLLQLLKDLQDAARDLEQIPDPEPGPGPEEPSPTEPGPDPGPDEPSPTEPGPGPEEPSPTEPGPGPGPDGPGAPTPDQPGNPAPGAPTPTPGIEQGKIYEAGGYSYRVLDSANHTVEITGMTNKNAKKITISGQVSLANTSCKIVSIAPSAFKNMKKAKTAVIGSNIETIGANAFLKCKALRKITIQSKVLKSVGKNALKGTSAKLQIKVPKDKYKAYKKLLQKKGQSKDAKIKK